MVRTKVRFNFSWPKRTPVIPKLNLDPLLSEAKEPFQLKLNNRFSCLSELSDPEEIYKEISSGILEAAKEVLPLQEKYQCSWMSDDTKRAIDEKHKIRKKNGAKSRE